jgi:hypothetical protein
MAEFSSLDEQWRKPRESKIINVFFILTSISNCSSFRIMEINNLLNLSKHLR